jgi:hypothetical protein
MPLYYLSFCDPDRPRGEKFLGGTIVEAPAAQNTIPLAWLLGINPGGEVAIAELDIPTIAELPEDAKKYVNTFVPREQVDGIPLFDSEPQGGK